MCKNALGSRISVLFHPKTSGDFVPLPLALLSMSYSSRRSRLYLLCRLSTQDPSPDFIRRIRGLRVIAQDTSDNAHTASSITRITMDSFSTISLPSASSETTSSVPVTYETGGVSNTYCVVAQQPDVPVLNETGGVSNTYCVIA